MTGEHERRAAAASWLGVGGLASEPGLRTPVRDLVASKGGADDLGGVVTGEKPRKL